MTKTVAIDFKEPASQRAMEASMARLLDWKLPFKWISRQ